MGVDRGGGIDGMRLLSYTYVPCTCPMYIWGPVYYPIHMSHVHVLCTCPAYIGPHIPPHTHGDMYSDCEKTPDNAHGHRLELMRDAVVVTT